MGVGLILIVQRHNEIIMDTICSLASLMWNQITKELVITAFNYPSESSLVGDAAI